MDTNTLLLNLKASWKLATALFAGGCVILAVYFYLNPREEMNTLTCGSKTYLMAAKNISADVMTLCSNATNAMQASNLRLKQRVKIICDDGKGKVVYTRLSYADYVDAHTAKCKSFMDNDIKLNGNAKAQRESKQAFLNTEHDAYNEETNKLNGWSKEQNAVDEKIKSLGGQVITAHK